jgi:hypothetical protein
MAPEVLYVTFDGVLQPLAFSQVVRVVAGLGGRGVRYHLLSYERPAELDRADLRAGVEAALTPAGVGWTTVRAGPPGSSRHAALGFARMAAQAMALVRRHRIRLIHARGYHGAAVALAVQRALGVPYLFDARGYWIEERTGPGTWFSMPAAYAMGKLFEQSLFRGARAVVTLTEPQAADVAGGLFGAPPRLLRVIPTCADYQAFYLREARPAQPDGASSVPDDARRALAGKTVLGVVGALNDTYFVRETLTLAKLALEAHPAMHLLVVSAQRREYEAALAATGVAPERYTVASATHTSMPDWLQWIDWGFLLVPETAANRAKMPTKLAEFFATGVRPVFFGCNSDAARWVDRAGTGRVLSGVDGVELRAAARHVAESRIDSARLREGRRITAGHFDLASGLERYDDLLAACLEGEPGSARAASSR